MARSNIIFTKRIIFIEKGYIFNFVYYSITKLRCKYFIFEKEEMREYVKYFMA